MPGQEENEDHRSHPRHLRSTSEAVPLRPSLERAYRSDSESEDDFSDLDTAPNGNHQYTNGRKWPWTARFRRIISGPGSSNGNMGKSRRGAPPRSRLRECCWRRRYCLIISGILLAGFITILSGGAFWVYKTAPKDGVCSPRTLLMTMLTVFISFHPPGTLHLKEAPSPHGRKATEKHKQWSSA